jgi:hypothetical protein
LSWNVTGAQNVDILPLGNSLLSSGSRTETFSLNQQVTLIATQGECSREKSILVTVQPVAPETITSGLVLGFAAIEVATVAVSQVVPVVTSGQNMFSFGFAIIDRVRRRYPWGIVYDSKTKKAVGRAIVRIFSAGKKSLVTTSVTNAQGIFRVFLKKGSYTISVTKEGYVFPSQLVTTTEDKQFMNVYRGEEFFVATDGQLLIKSIPIDQQKVVESNSLSKLWITLSPYIEYINSLVLLSGMGFSFYTVFVNPTLINMGVVCFYIGISVIKLLLLQVPTRGIAKDSQGKAVPGLEIGLFDGEFKNIIATTFTDEKGHYSFCAGNQDYVIKVLDNNYILKTNGNTDGIVIKKQLFGDGARVIMAHLSVKKK